MLRLQPYTYLPPTRTKRPFALGPRTNRHPFAIAPSCIRRSLLRARPSAILRSLACLGLSFKPPESSKPRISCYTFPGCAYPAATMSTTVRQRSKSTAPAHLRDFHRGGVRGARVRGVRFSPENDGAAGIEVCVIELSAAANESARVEPVCGRRVGGSVVSVSETRYQAEARRRTQRWTTRCRLSAVAVAGEWVGHGRVRKPDQETRSRARRTRLHNEEERAVYDVVGVDCNAICMHTSSPSGAHQSAPGRVRMRVYICGSPSRPPRRTYETSTGATMTLASGCTARGACALPLRMTALLALGSVSSSSLRLRTSSSMRELSLCVRDVT
ncbi:hypothetical protein C8Q77DRAFT_27904 [Trametes polyzona]|nr:hypothetical protein C8Q77DRAFT_27904 [Trametes polyzona]